LPDPSIARAAVFKKPFQLYGDDPLKRLLPALLISLSLTLAACQAQATSQPVSPATDTALPPTRQAAPTQTTAPTGITGASAASSPGCTVESPRPTPGPTEQSLFPPVSEQDWVAGPESASVTIIEYSDFQ
jgi:protein-disulfide isomerase